MELHSLPKELAGSGPALSLSDTGHGCHAQRNIRHGCSLNALEGTLMWTQVVHVHTLHTCEQCRQQKQQTQASSEAIQMHVPVQIRRHLRVYQWPTQPHCWSHDCHVTNCHMHLINLIRLQCQHCVLSKGLRVVHGWQLLDVVLAGLWWSVLGDGAVLWGEQSGDTAQQNTQ